MNLELFKCPYFVKPNNGNVKTKLNMTPEADEKTTELSKFKNAVFKKSSFGLLKSCDLYQLQKNKLKGNNHLRSFRNRESSHPKRIYNTRK